MDEKPKCKTRNYKKKKNTHTQKKPLRGKQRQNTNDMNQSKIFYDSPPKVMETKTKISKWDLLKFKSFCTAKESTNKVKRQPSE